MGAWLPRVFLSCPILAAKCQRLRKSCPHPKSGTQRSVSSPTGWQCGRNRGSKQMGHGYFMFCLEFMLTKRKKKKNQERKDFLEAGRCLLCFTRCLKGTRPRGGPSRHTARGGPAAAVWRLANQTETDKEEMEIDILLVSKKPKVIFTNKIFDDFRKTRSRRIKQENDEVFDKRVGMRSSRRGCPGDCAPLVCWGDAREPTGSRHGVSRLTWARRRENHLQLQRFNFWVAR